MSEKHTKLIRKLPFELIEASSPIIADDVFLIRDKNKETVFFTSMGIGKQRLAEYIIKACNEYEQLKKENKELKQQIRYLEVELEDESI